jgi:hypothetical protein
VEWALFHAQHVVVKTVVILYLVEKIVKKKMKFPGFPGRRIRTIRTLLLENRPPRGPGPNAHLLSGCPGKKPRFEETRVE